MGEVANQEQVKGRLSLPSGKSGPHGVPRPLGGGHVGTATKLLMDWEETEGSKSP